MSINGYFFQQGQSKKHPASLTITQNGFLTLQTVDGVLSTPIHVHISQVTIEDAIGNIPRTLTFPNGIIFTANIQSQMDEQLNSHVQSSWMNRLEKSKKGIVIGILVTAAFIGASYLYGIPFLTEVIVKHTPDSVYQASGKQALAQLDITVFKPSALPIERQKQLQQRFQILATQANVNQHGTPQLLFRKLEETPNAMALADGSIVVTDALIELLKTDEQIDAVILHELGHVHHEHVMKSIINSSLISLGFALVIGDSSNIADTISSGAAFALTMQHSRQMETQADEFAVSQLLSKQNGTSQPLIDAFILLKNNKPNQDNTDSNQIASWFDSHPAIDERIKHIQAKMPHP